MCVLIGTVLSSRAGLLSGEIAGCGWVDELMVPPMRRAIAALGIAVVALSALVGPVPARASDNVDPGSRMLLVLDSSGSMAEKTPDGSTRIEAAKDALRQVIAKLPAEQEVGLRVYGAEVFSRDQPDACTDSQLVVRAGTDNRAELTAALDDYKPHGETPIGHALEQAGKDLGSEGPRTIVLVSDGEPTCEPDPCEVASELSKTGIDVRIDVVGLDVAGEARDKLRCIAENGNGTYYDADSAADLVKTLEVSTTRASRPFDLSGTPVTGTATAAQAPTLENGGVYVDRVPGRDGVWYRVPRTVTGSTIHVGVTHFSAGIGNSGDTLAMHVYVDPTRDYCRLAMSFARGSLAFTAAHTWRERSDDACNTADEVYVRVRPSLGGDQLGKPMQLVVYEEPPLADPSLRSAAPKPELPTWQSLEPGTPRRDVVPGTAFTNAPLVTDGSYALDINPGETQVLAVPLDWGQNLQAQIDASNVTSKMLGWYKDLYLQIASPVRGETSTDFYGVAEEPEDWTGSVVLFGDEAIDYRTGDQSVTVAYVNRLESKSALLNGAIPGWRYVLVSHDKSAEEPISYTLTLKTNGKAGEGAPEYAKAEGLAPPIANSALVGKGGVTTKGEVDTSVDATSLNDPSAENADAGGRSRDSAGATSLLIVILAAAGTLALGGGAGWLLARRRS